MIIYCDIDGTICQNTYGFYSHAKPYVSRIQKLNNLFDKGYKIVYYTARGATSGIDWTELTKKQLDFWGVKYTEIKLGKPHYDFWLDDKAFGTDHLDEFFKKCESTTK